MKTLLCTVAIGAMALMGCSKNSEQPPDPALTMDTAEPLPAPTMPTSTLATDSADAASAVFPKSIPNAMIGRWALVPADCTSTKGDAKGLMIIGAATLRFYESTASLAKVLARTDTMLRAQYAFSGEGMEWQRDMSLTLQDGGKVLIRQEFGKDAATGPFKYTSCT